jgi:SPP1 gp7 family putative phage head morphogenesis protein
MVTLTKESQKKIEKAAAAMAATEAAILVSSSEELVPIFVTQTTNTMSKATEATLTKSTRDQITKDLLKEYKTNMTTRGGSICGTEVVEKLPGNRVKVTVRSEFKPWLKDIPANERREISKIISKGIEEFKNPRLIAKDLESHMSGTRHNSISAARSEASKNQYYSNIQTRKEAGQEYLIYRSALLETTRPAHAARDGKYYKIGTQPALNEINCLCTYSDGTLDVLNGAPVEESGAIIMDADTYYSKI